MKVSLRFIARVLTTFFLVTLGAALQFQWNVVGRFVSNERVRETMSTTKLGSLINTDIPTSVGEVDFSHFWEAWNLLESDYLETEKLDPKVMTDGAIAGMTAALGDPYTIYLDPKDAERSTQDLAGAFFGVGIELGFVDGTLAVMSPLSGSPAEAAGVKAGDLILRIKDEAKGIDETTADLSILDAVEKIRGPEGTPVVLTLFRDNNGNEPFDVTITRGEIVVKSVELEIVEQGGKSVAHIKLSRFGGRTDGEWDAVVTKILAERQTLDGIVLDVRNNPGGFFDGAIAVASEFIKSGTVVSQQGRLQNQDFKSLGSARLVGIPTVVLVNRGSASASEIVAGALNAQLQTKLIGEKTFGKGTVQDVRTLKNEGVMHITIARWVMPNGEWIHKEGIPVDVEVQDDQKTPEDEQLTAAIKAL
ncbi:MAG: S41 family peptidase [bacterium]|nr:S41 family peptidase [bacterium]